jgi:menaquinone-9 beta-reductase
VPPQWYTNLRPIEPLATFDGTDSWVKHPYKHGVALLSDAAATTDPSHGQGQSLTLRDARVLRDQLLASNDWDAAAHAYANEHDRYFSAVHKFYDWFWQILYDPSRAGSVHRTRVLPQLTQDITRMPDTLASGPEVPLDERPDAVSLQKSSSCVCEMEGTKRARVSTACPQRTATKFL